MDLETTKTNTTVKLPLLKQGEYDLWKLRIEQYFQVQEYALWDVIENGNSFKPAAQTTTNAEGVMELENSQNNALAKLPMLKLGEYEMWEIRIKQYFQIQDYALWEVIENGNSWVPIPVTATETGPSTGLKMTVPSTAEEKICKKNDVKARSLLLMALPNEHQLTFDHICLSIQSTTKCPQLVHEDLEQLHDDNLEEMDLKWNMALLSMRARKFYKRTGRKIIIDGSNTAGYDKSKMMRDALSLTLRLKRKTVIHTATKKESLLNLKTVRRSSRYAENVQVHKDLEETKGIERLQLPWMESSMSINRMHLRRHLKLDDQDDVSTFTSPSRITSSPSHSPEPSPSPAPSFEHSPDHTTAAPTQPSPTQPSTGAEHHFPTPHDSPLHAIHSHGSDEGSLKLNELTNLVTKLSERIGVLEDDLRKTKKTYKARVKIGKARRRAKVVLSEDDKDVEDDSSNRVGNYLMQEVQDKARSSEKGSVEVSTAGATKGTASEVPVVSTAEENISTAGRTVTYRRRSEEQRTRKDKEAIMTESKPKKKSKKSLNRKS
ncbi:hypothetical protein Tco_0938873 [Tanacetum coccineum]|uniref:Uncharacterized protein n=1 Tax=Tanacetum coccineum TaxID=301880 RepID=A0ABQ5DJC9_9ASTR